MDIASMGSDVIVTSARATVCASAARHMLVVTAQVPSGFLRPEVWYLGATRAGLATFLAVVRDKLNQRRLSSDEARALHDAAMDALRTAAIERGANDVDIAAAIGVEGSTPGSTPLIYSERFLRARFLRSDALRFRACRVAICSIDDDDDDNTPERADALVEKLERWRDLFAHDGKARRAHHKTLAAFADEASAHALWGLRNVPLLRTVPSLLHLELLGSLGAHPSAVLLGPQMRIIQRTPADEIENALTAMQPLLCALPEGTSALHALVEMIALVDDADDDVPDSLFGFRGLVAAGLAQFERNVSSETRTAEPPVALPQIPGVTLLRTVGEILDEGIKMRHCVAMRRYLALRGQAFIFHVEHAGERATVQVDRNGNVVEARGPKNVDNAAARWGSLVLNGWGRSFWLSRWPMWLNVWRVLWPPPLGSQALMSVGACARAYESACKSYGDVDGRLASWFTIFIERAIEGEVGLVLQPNDRGACGPIVVAIDRQGRKVGSTEAIIDVPAYLPPPL